MKSSKPGTLSWILICRGRQREFFSCSINISKGGWIWPMPCIVRMTELTKDCDVVAVDCKGFSAPSKEWPRDHPGGRASEALTCRQFLRAGRLSGGIASTKKTGLVSQG